MLFLNFLKRLAIIRIDGSINLEIEQQLLQIIGKLQSKRVSALSLIINSCGGSIRSAKAIADALKNYRNVREVPIYCFAQDYCLNSANLILTMGTKSFAHQLSTIGDFGFSTSVLQLDRFQQQFGIGKIQISPMTNNKVLTGPFSTVNVSDIDLLTKVVEEDSKQLREEIIANRLAKIKQKNQTVAQFTQSILSKTVIQSADASEHGLVDEVSSFAAFKQKHFKQFWISEQNKKYKNPFFRLYFEGADLLKK